MTAVEVLDIVLAWLDVYYGEVEILHPRVVEGKVVRAMVQLDHSSEEYEARMDVAVAVRAFFDEEKG